MKYILNSAVVTKEGTYTYRLLDSKEAGVWIAQNYDQLKSYVGYPATQDFIRRKFGVEVPLSREAMDMKFGDQALVVRLKYRVQNPTTKADVAPSDDDFELGLLTKVS